MTRIALVFLLSALAAPANDANAGVMGFGPTDGPEPVKIGIIGLDTSHSIAFTRSINALDAEGLAARYEVVAAYAYGSRTIESSYERIPGYIEAVEEMGVEVVDSIDELLARVDFILLETNDGKPHLRQALRVIKAGKPFFLDKPAAASLADVVSIYEAADEAGVPLFSSSSLRYMPNAQAVRNGSIGRVNGAFIYGPAILEPSHPDLYWYGIHVVETLFTVMGTGCETVVRTHTDGADAVTCTWEDGRIGTAYGIRSSKRGYGGTAFSADAIVEVGPYEGYEPLVQTILEFFETGDVPIQPEETIEIYAFMSAADESKRRGGEPVRISEVLEAARAEASAKLDAAR